MPGCDNRLFVDAVLWIAVEAEGATAVIPFPQER